MRRIKWIDGGEYNLDDSKKFVEFMQMKHPFCEEINNAHYMQGVRNSFSEIYNLDKKLIDITSEEAFVKSFEAIGLAEIFVD